MGEVGPSRAPVNYRTRSGATICRSPDLAAQAPVGDRLRDGPGAGGVAVVDRGARAEHPGGVGQASGAGEDVMDVVVDRALRRPGRE